MTDIYSIYNATGLIVKKLQTLDVDLANANVESGEFILNSDLDPETQYITGVGTTNTITTRPLLSTIVSWNTTTITANNSSTATLSGIPVGSNYNITVPTGVTSIPPGTTTTSLNFKTDFPGLYTVEIDSFPYQLYSQTITAS